MPRSKGKEKGKGKGKGDGDKKPWLGFFGKPEDWKTEYTAEEKAAFPGDYAKYENHLSPYMPENPAYGRPIPLESMYLLEKTRQAALVHVWCGPRWLNAVVYATEEFFELQGVGSKIDDIGWFNDGNSENFYNFAGNINNKVQVKGELMSITKQFKPGMFQMDIIPINIILPFSNPRVVVVGCLSFMTPVGGSQGASTGITPALRRAAQCCDYSAMGSAMIDRKGKKIMYENTAFEKLYRQILAATKSVVGDDYSDDNHLLTILGRDEEKLKEMNEALDEKKPFECRSMIKAAQAGEGEGAAADDGLWLEVELCIAPDSASSEWIISINIDDITQKVVLENKSKDAIDMLFANMSHELKTPLNGIIALSEVLCSDLEEDGVSQDDDTYRSLNVIRTSGLRLNNLVTNLLDASLLKKKKLNIRTEDEINLHKLAEDICKLNAALTKDEVKIVNSVSPKLETFLGDSVRLSQIIQNLVNNALKFTFVGSITISAKLESHNKIINIAVTDTGIGIPKEKQDLVFARLRQVDEAADRKFGGTGLGLAISKDLVVGMGGEFHLTSREGVGSTFSFTIPYVQSLDKRVKEKAQAQKREAALATGASTASGSDRYSETSSQASRSKNKVGSSAFSEDSSEFEQAEIVLPSCADVTGQVEVLSIDDEPSNQAVVGALLRKRKYKITKAMNGIEAIEILDKRREDGTYMPDIILCDVMMPKMNGFECCAKIREDFPLCAIPIIMVSAKSREENIIQGLNCGSNDYVTKPFKKLELLARIDTQLKLRKAWVVEMEREKSDVLLQRMLPHHIITRLKSETGGGAPIADEHKNVAILFSDIVGFTTMSATTPTIEIIDKLNKMFTAFDSLTDKNHVYKVETIGDAYMCAAGHLPTDVITGDACVRMLQMAVDMIGEMEANEEESGLKVRIGIHCGPAHSGVVGTKMPRYCFFGDTVNTASRMESTGFPSCIQVSGAFRDRILEDKERGSTGADGFDFELYGEREIKGKGLMPTYLVKAGEYQVALKVRDEKKEKEANEKRTPKSPTKEDKDERKETEKTMENGGTVLAETYHRVRLRAERSQSFSHYHPSSSADMQLLIDHEAEMSESKDRIDQLSESNTLLTERNRVLEMELLQLKAKTAEAGIDVDNLGSRSGSIIIDGGKEGGLAIAAQRDELEEKVGALEEELQKQRQRVAELQAEAMAKATAEEGARSSSPRERGKFDPNYKISPEHYMDTPKGREIADPLTSGAAALQAMPGASQLVNQLPGRSPLGRSAGYYMTAHPVDGAPGAWAAEMLPPSEWDDAMVSGWMVSSMPIFAAKYVTTFLDMGVDGEMLLALTETDLKELGVNKRLHLVRFRAEIERLRQRDAVLKVAERETMQ